MYGGRVRSRERVNHSNVDDRKASTEDGAIETTGKRREHGPSGGRPAEVFRFRTSRLEVTDPFAVFRPPV